MKVNWFLESDMYGDDIKGLIEEIKNQGHGLKILSDVNYWDTKWLNLFEEKDCVIYYGGLQMGAIISREAPWIPGLYSTIPNYSCLRYYPIFGDLLLNSSYIMIPFGELLRLKDWLYEKVGTDNAIFIRPTSGNKTFTGRLVYKENFEKDYNIFTCYDCPSDEVCVVAEPRNIAKEWRFLVVDNQIVTGSEYKPNKIRVDEISEAAVFAEYALSKARIKGYSPDRAWTLDICQTVFGNFYVLEIGCFSCAGMYDMDPEIIIKEISRIALEDWKEVYN